MGNLQKRQSLTVPHTSQSGQQSSQLSPRLILRSVLKEIASFFVRQRRLFFKATWENRLFKATWGQRRRNYSPYFEFWVIPLIKYSSWTFFFDFQKIILGPLCHLVRKWIFNWRISILLWVSSMKGVGNLMNCSYSSNWFLEDKSLKSKIQDFTFNHYIFYEIIIKRNEVERTNTFHVYYSSGKWDVGLLKNCSKGKFKGKRVHAQVD